MALDYDELRRKLEERQRAEQQPAARRPAARPGTRPAGTRPGARPPAGEAHPELHGTQRRRAPLPPRPPVELVVSSITAVFLLPAIAVFLVGRGVEPVESFPWRLGVLIGAGAAVGWALVVMQFLRKYGEPQSTAAGLWGPIAIFGFAAVAFSLAMTGALTVLNARLDKTPEKIERVMVLDKARIGSSNGRSVRVTVPLWTDVGVHLQFMLPDTLYDQIKPRRTQLIVHTRSGAFGWQWIENASEVAEIPVVEAPPPVVAVAPPPPPTGSATIPEADRAEARQIMERALVALRANQRENAVNDFKRSIELDPFLALAYFELEKALVALQEHDQMAEYWGRLIERNPSSRDAFYGRARMRIAKNDRLNALEDAEQACRLSHIQACQLAEKLRTETGR